MNKKLLSIVAGAVLGIGCAADVQVPDEAEDICIEQRTSERIDPGFTANREGAHVTGSTRRNIGETLEFRLLDEHGQVIRLLDEHGVEIPDSKVLYKVKEDAEFDWSAKFKEQQDFFETRVWETVGGEILIDNTNPGPDGLCGVAKQGIPNS